MKPEQVEWQEEAFRKIIAVIEMQSDMEWTKKYYSEEAQARIAENAGTWTPELQAKVEQEWKILINDVESAIAEKTDPSSLKAKTLAQRWSELVRGFTRGNAEIQQGLDKLYADEGNWPASFTKPFSDEVWQFIQQAMAAHKISCA